MSIDASSGTTSELDFERVQTEGEEETGPLSCGACQRQITGQYFTVGAAILCDSCRHRFEMERSQHSRAGAFARAGAYGLVAALAGAALWGGVIWVSGYELGIIAIVVGVMVGAAVKKGSGGIGGRPCQALAVALTYLAVTLAYVPLVVQGIRQARAEAAAAQTEAPDAATPPLEATAAEVPVEPAADAALPVAEPTLAADAAGEDAGPTAGQIALACAAILGIAASVPFLSGFENAIGLLIIGFALWEAWKRSAGVELSVMGPYQVGSAGGA